MRRFRGAIWGAVRLKGFKMAVHSCGAVVFEDQSAESVAALDFSVLGGVSGLVGSGVPETARVRGVALAVVMGCVDAENGLEVAAADDQLPVETFVADGAN
jgi:hypothetical protein